MSDDIDFDAWIDSVVAERDSLRAAVDAAQRAVGDYKPCTTPTRNAYYPGWLDAMEHVKSALAAALGATTEPDRCVKCWQFPPCNCAGATTTQTSGAVPQAVQERADAYDDAVAALYETNHAPLSTTIGYLIRQGYLVRVTP